MSCALHEYNKEIKQEVLNVWLPSRCAKRIVTPELGVSVIHVEKTMIPGPSDYQPRRQGLLVFQ